MASCVRMTRLPAALVLLAASASPAPSQDVFRQLSGLSVTVETAHAYPGGVLVVKLYSQRPIGPSTVAFDGRRATFYPSARGLRALVPVPVGAPAGTRLLGLEVQGRSGRRRIPLEVEIAARTYPQRDLQVPEALGPLLDRPEATRDGRRLLSLLWTETPNAERPLPFKPPVSGTPGAGFGVRWVFADVPALESRLDSIHGDDHRGIDYPVAAGTTVVAPAAGTVLFASPLVLSGETLVLDHGQGILSVFFHLGRIQVGEGERVEPGRPIAVSGESGLALSPHVHWGVYVHGVAVDPAVILSLAE